MFHKRTLFNHVVGIWKTFDSDAERVMVLTGHELTSHLRDVDRKKPDKLALKDATHAARRVLQRPWRADSELHGILNKLITGKS